MVKAELDADGAAYWLPILIQRLKGMDGVLEVPVGQSYISEIAARLGVSNALAFDICQLGLSERKLQPVQEGSNRTGVALGHIDLSTRRRRPPEKAPEPKRTEPESLDHRLFELINGASGEIQEDPETPDLLAYLCEKLQAGRRELVGMISHYRDRDRLNEWVDDYNRLHLSNPNYEQTTEEESDEENEEVSEDEEEPDEITVPPTPITAAALPSQDEVQELIRRCLEKERGYFGVLPGLSPAEAMAATIEVDAHLVKQALGILRTKHQIHYVELRGRICLIALN